jgi:hypothetical protein
VQRALRERWPIPKALRGRVINRLARVVDDADVGPREVTAAAKAILSASKLNQGNIATSAKALELFELEHRVSRLERRERGEEEAEDEYSDTYG